MPPRIKECQLPQLDAPSRTGTIEGAAVEEALELVAHSSELQVRRSVSKQSDRWSCAERDATVGPTGSKFTGHSRETL